MIGGWLMFLFGWLCARWCEPVIGNDFKSFACGWVIFIGVMLIIFGGVYG